MRNFIFTILMGFFVISAWGQTPTPPGEDVASFDNVASEGTTQSISSYSDFNIQAITGSSHQEDRNPFAPGLAQDEFDPSSLAIQGIIIGAGDVQMSLINDQFFNVGDRIGNYTISEIKQGRVILTQLEDRFVVQMKGYTPSLEKRHEDLYFVEFFEADLKQALRMLSKANKINIMMPEDVNGKVTVSFNNTLPLDVISTLLKVNKLEYAMEGNIMRVGPAEQFKDDSDLKALTVPLKYATATELQEKVKAFLSDRGSAISDERTNIIIVKDHKSVLENVQKFLAEVDRQDPQVSIEAKIIDASRSFVQSLGIQWGMTSGPGNVVVRGNQNVGAISGGNTTGLGVNLPASNPTSGIDVLVGRLPGNMTLESQLSAAEANGMISIISKPNVTTINNKPAKLRSGLKIYVKVQGGQNEGPTLKEIDTGIELKVTPQITLNRMIKMTIEAVQSEADFSRTVDDIPSIIDNTATTTVLIPDGETAVIGGLLKVNSTSEKKKVPGLGNVPGLGLLFKNSNKSKAGKELMIFITPKILDQRFMRMSANSALEEPLRVSADKIIKKVP